MIKFVWCCYKAISFTYNLIIHLFSEIGPAQFLCFMFIYLTLNSISQGVGHATVCPSPIYGACSNWLDFNLCFYLRDYRGQNEWFLVLLGLLVPRPGVTNRCIHIYSRGCDVLTISLQGNLNRFISSWQTPPLRCAFFLLNRYKTRFLGHFRLLLNLSVTFLMISKN